MAYSMSDLLQLVVSEGSSDLHIRVDTIRSGQKNNSSALLQMLIRLVVETAHQKNFLRRRGVELGRVNPEVPIVGVLLLAVLQPNPQGKFYRFFQVRKRQLDTADSRELSGGNIG